MSGDASEVAFLKGERDRLLKQTGIQTAENRTLREDRDRLFAKWTKANESADHYKAMLSGLRFVLDGMNARAEGLTQYNDELRAEVMALRAEKPHLKAVS